MTGGSVPPVPPPELGAAECPAPKIFAVPETQIVCAHAGSVIPSQHTPPTNIAQICPFMTNSLVSLAGRLPPPEAE